MGSSQTVWGHIAHKNAKNGQFQFNWLMTIKHNFQTQSPSGNKVFHLAECFQLRISS